ncbi:MAG: YHS domain-containing protein [Candidatus Longimicrobiales bacterium M2_2A_002]
MTVKDPVCGMQIEKEDAVARVEYKGKAYYFCSEDCSSEFEDNPEDYADEGGVVE